MATCGNCDSADLVHCAADGDIVCRECGAVVEGHTIDESGERVYDESDSRVGAPGDATATAGLHIRGALPRRFHRLDVPYSERCMQQVFSDISRVCSTQLRLTPNIVDSAKELYKDIKDKRISRGSVHKALVAASVYFACKLQKQEGVSRRKLEICNAFAVEERSFSNACKLVKDLLSDKAYHKGLFETMDSNDLIVRAADGFGYPRERKYALIKAVRALDDRVRAAGVLHGKHPSSVVAALFQVVCERDGYDVSRKDICSICGVSAVTLAKISRVVCMFT